MIGVFDSGIGGLSVLKALRERLPHEDFIYIADSAHAPYGQRDDDYVVVRARAISQYLVSRNVKALVIACNTATAAAIHVLRAEHPGLPIIGVEPALKPAALLSKTGNVGIMATRSTLASAKFRALMASQAGFASFTLEPCDGLADAIERSAKSRDSAELIAACARITCRMGSFGTQKGQMDTLVLGCTHYPFAAAHLRALVGPDVQLVDTGEAVARQTVRQLESTDALRACPNPANTGMVSLFTTGQADTLHAAASHWLGLSATSKMLLF